MCNILKSCNLVFVVRTHVRTVKSTRISVIKELKKEYKQSKNESLWKIAKSVFKHSSKPHFSIYAIVVFVPSIHTFVSSRSGTFRTRFTWWGTQNERRRAVYVCVYLNRCVLACVFMCVCVCVCCCYYKIEILHISAHFSFHPRIVGVFVVQLMCCYWCRCRCASWAQLSNGTGPKHVQNSFRFEFVNSKEVRRRKMLPINHCVL